MAGAARARVTSAPEASGCLVAPPVFKTGGRRAVPSAGSIPVRLRVDPAREMAGCGGVGRDRGSARPEASTYRPAHLPSPGPAAEPPAGTPVSAAVARAQELARGTEDR